MLHRNQRLVAGLRNAHRAGLISRFVLDVSAPAQGKTVLFCRAVVAEECAKPAVFRGRFHAGGAPVPGRDGDNAGVYPGCACAGGAPVPGEEHLPRVLQNHTAPNSSAPTSQALPCAASRYASLCPGPRKSLNRCHWPYGPVSALALPVALLLPLVLCLPLPLVLCLPLPLVLCLPLSLALALLHCTVHQHSGCRTEAAVLLCVVSGDGQRFKEGVPEAPHAAGPRVP